MLFLVPLLGAAMGAAAEALNDTGGNDDFMREVSADLRPGAAAVFALVKQAPADMVVLEIAQYGGRLVQTSLSPEEEGHLREMARAARGGAAGVGAAG
jgi:uncharacterized membrane protein